MATPSEWLHRWHRRQSRSADPGTSSHVSSRVAAAAGADAAGVLSGTAARHEREYRRWLEREIRRSDRRVGVLVGATLFAGMSFGVYLHVYGGATLNLLLSSGEWALSVGLRNLGVILLGGLVLRFLWSRTTAEWRLRVELTRGGLRTGNSQAPSNDREDAQGLSPTLGESLRTIAGRIASTRLRPFRDEEEA